MVRGMRMSYRKLCGELARRAAYIAYQVAVAGALGMRSRK